jgi:hypothetical protein
MATYTLNAGEISAHDKQLVASTVDRIVFPNHRQEVEIVWDGTAKGYVRVDGSAPATSGAFSYLMPAYPCKRVITLPDVPGTGTAHVASEVQIISAGTPVYSVTAA